MSCRPIDYALLDRIQRRNDAKATYEEAADTKIKLINNIRRFLSRKRFDQVFDFLTLPFTETTNEDMFLAYQAALMLTSTSKI